MTDIHDRSGCVTTLTEVYGLYVELLTRIAVLENTQAKDVEALRERICLSDEARDKALELEAAKMDKHFTALNGEAERLKAMQATYWPRELAESRVDAVAAAVEARALGLEKAIRDLADFRADTGGRRAALTPVVNHVVTVVAVIVSATLGGVVGFVLHAMTK